LFFCSANLACDLSNSFRICFDDHDANITTTHQRHSIRPE